MPEALIKKFLFILGDQNLITAEDQMRTYIEEPRHKFNAPILAVLRPENEDQIIQILALCRCEQISIIPQGGNTGLVGGQVGMIDLPRAVILNLALFNSLSEVDEESQTLLAGAGAILDTVCAKADAQGYEFALRLGSGGSAQVGGLLAANAGGTQALVHGSARDLCMGVRAILANGDMIDETQPLKKNNAGYYLSPLFIGSEGTLGIITAARLKLVAKPSHRHRFLVGFAQASQAVHAFTRLHKHFGNNLTMAELFPLEALNYQFDAGWLDHVARPPKAAWYALFDVDVHQTGQPCCLNEIFKQLMAPDGVQDVLMAQSQTQARQFLEFRENIPEIQRHQGGSIKHDVSVPTGKIAALLQRGIAQAQAFMPGIRPLPFGHMGDGNIHFNFSQPKDMDTATFLAAWEDLNAIIHPIVLELGGSIAAEHGVGQLKKHWLLKARPKAEIETMKTLKRALDPHNILNTGKVIDL